MVSSKQPKLGLPHALFFSRVSESTIGYTFPSYCMEFIKIGLVANVLKSKTNYTVSTKSGHESGAWLLMPSDADTVQGLTWLKGERKGKFLYTIAQ